MNNILITGGSGDIGAEIIKHLLKKIEYFLYYRNYKNANNLYKKIKRKVKIYTSIKFQIATKEK